MDILYSIGMIGDGFLLAKLGGFKNRLQTMLTATVVVGIAIILLGIFDVYWFLLFAMFLYGLAIPFINAPATVYIQESIDKKYHGRTFGFYSMISAGVMPIGMVIFGPLADFISIPMIFIGSGIVLLLVGAWMFSIRGAFQPKSLS